MRILITEETTILEHVFIFFNTGGIVNDMYLIYNFYTFT